MRAYLIRRLLLTVPTLFIVSFVIFVVIRFMPGDIVDAEISEVVPGIPLGTPYQLRVTWPWVKNWYGETEESAWGTAHINARIWIDQELKKSLGY